MNPASIAYLQLGGAILLEVVATVCLKQSEGMSRVIPTVVALSGNGVSFYLLAQVLKDVPMGISYGIWSGTGIVLSKAGLARGKMLSRRRRPFLRLAAGKC